MVRRFLGLFAVMAMVMALAGGTASAGGAVWRFEDRYHERGEVVATSTAVAWSHNEALGTPEDGPYLVYLARASAEPESWPGLPDDALLVGYVEVDLGRFEGEAGRM